MNRGRQPDERAELAEHFAQLEGRLERIEGRLESLRPLLLSLARDDPGHRRRLHDLRASAEYELAFTEPDPLVSVVICARGDRAEVLTSRAVPSALDQTYANLEVVIVGDAAGEDVRAAVAGLGDSRIRFADLTQRFVRPDGMSHWMTGSTLTRNEGHRMARGRWIADLDDDDALRSGAVASLLALARAQHLEVAYGVMEQVAPSGERNRLGRFPPAPREPNEGEPALPYQPWDGSASCAALVHAGLRLFGREWVAADVPMPGDYFLLERMVRAGVRFGMLDEVVYDYYPSSLWQRPADPAAG
ncbi:MAG: glycosyltransferase [Solirubrobacteraceae bacterium]